MASGLTIGLALAGCGGGDTLQEAVGFDRAGPDEMAVIKRPPLILPPDYNLRPPRSADEEAAGNAASQAARRTLIGPSSSIEDAGDDARALLTGVTPENGADSDNASEGQSFLVSRTDRTEGLLDSIAETRGESRVDRALLRRLLAWSPEDRPAPVEGDEAEQAVVVQVVSRRQTVIDVATNPE